MIQLRSAIWPLLAAPLLLASCDDDGTSPSGLTLDQVAGVYEVCALVFTPTGSQPPVDIHARAFETTDPQVRPPQLRIDASGELQLAYTPREMFVEQDVRGRARTTSGQVWIDFDTRGTRTATSLLLPSPLILDFTETPRALEVQTTAFYSVPRDDYTRLAGVSDAGLADQIPGTLAASFRHGGCD